MSYKINWDFDGGVFAVPDCIADDFLRLASPKYAKVVLYLFRHKNGCDYDAKKIAAAVGIEADDAEDALSYWEQVGVIFRGGRRENEKPAVNPPKEIPAVAAPPEHTVSEARMRERAVKSLPPAEIAARIKSSDEIGFLFKSAEDILAKTLNYTESCVLILLFDYYGLSADIIIMIIAYCKLIGKTSISKIESIAKEWHEKGITTHEQADAEIRRMQQSYTLTGKIKSRLEINRALTSSEKKFANDWAEKGIDIELAVFAYEKTVAAIGKLSFNYMNKIILGWFERGVITKEQAERADAESPNGKKRGNVNAEPSYNIDKILEHSMNHIPKYKSRKKKSE